MGDDTLADDAVPKPRARKFRTRRAEPLGRPPAARAESAVVRDRAAQPKPEPEAKIAPPPAARPSPGETQVEDVRREGLTGRQLRMARRVAQRHGIAATSDFDAVRELRDRGIDPFQQTNLLALVQGGGSDDDGAVGATPLGGPQGGPEGIPVGGEVAVPSGRVQLPQTRPATLPAPRPGTQVGTPGPRGAPVPDDGAGAARAAEIVRIQRDIVGRRRRKSIFLLLRLAVFVLLPTFAAGWYYERIATPMYATKSEFVIQKAESAAAGAAGLGGLFQGTSMATQQDSMAVQAFLSSRSALARLDADHGFRDAFSAPTIDPVQRLPENASAEEAYRLYQSHVKISYDPTEGIVKMEVIAPDPKESEQFSRALIGYAEEQVDHLTSRLRADQMADARQSYQDAETRRADALQAWLGIQEQVQQIDPVGETAARTSQISALETQRQQLELELQGRLSVPRPNAAQVDGLRARIANIESLIAQTRDAMTSASANGASLASKNTELRTAEENYTFQTLQVQQAQAAMEVARTEANRQVRYLSLGVEPVAPDEATYPRAFENTALAFLIFAGIYLMASLTASILREQVTS